MGSLAQLAKAAGYEVSGCDTGVYPPMSDQLQQAGISLTEGFGEHQLDLKPDLFVVGNVVSRGNPLMEAILDTGLPYVSGPQWFAEHILAGRWVLAVSGTHGKTTTTSMLTWILEYAGFSPGFLVGGVPENFSVSARLGESDFFVVEADEYDTAFFDKRSKFVHYKPRTLIINNLEFDHADIFEDLPAIQRQFHHLVRIVPRNGLVIFPKPSESVQSVIDQGCWSELQRSSSQDAEWFAQEQRGGFDAYFKNDKVASVQWRLSGKHNIENALHAMAAARHVGVLPELAAEALCAFKGVKRRMELVGKHNNLFVYDDFAHHPTAIASTLEGLRKTLDNDAEIVAVIEPRSNTMRMGVHRDALLQSADLADKLFWFEADTMPWSLADAVKRADGSSEVHKNHAQLLDAILAFVEQRFSESKAKTLHIVVMSNGGFGGVPRKLMELLRSKI